MWGIGCCDPFGGMGFFGPSAWGCAPFFGGMWGCSSMFMGPSFYSPFNFYGGFAGSMIGSGIGGALGYFVAGGARNPWMGMTGAFLGSSLGSSLGWMAGSFGL